jgi:hypothetical protein
MAAANEATTGAHAQVAARPVRDRVLRIAPWLLLVTLALDVAAVMLGLTARRGAQEFAVQPPISSIVGAVLSLSYGIVGAILTARLPRNPVGWLLTLVGVLTAVTIVGWYYAGYAYASVPPLLPAANVVVWVSVSFGSPAYIAALVILLTVFPDGRTLPGRWSRLPTVIAVIAAVSAVATAFGPGSVTYFEGVPKPFALSGLAGDIVEAVRIAIVVVAGVVLAIAAASLVIRYRGSASVERAQLRWIAYAAVVDAFLAIPAFLIYTGAEAALFRPGSMNGVIVWLIFATAASMIPIACLFAITRYRLYAIDRIISDTFVYGALIAIVAGLYAGMNDLLRRVFIAVTGQQSDAAIVITTLVLAMTLTPVRQRLERVAGKRLKPGDEDATQAAEMDPQLIEAVAQRAADLAMDRVVERLAARDRAVPARRRARPRG